MKIILNTIIFVLALPVLVAFLVATMPLRMFNINTNGFNAISVLKSILRGWKQAEKSAKNTSTDVFKELMEELDESPTPPKKRRSKTTK